MRITKEDFNKLSKKKQDELKDKIKKIKDKYSFDKLTYVWLSFIKYLLYTFVIFLIVIPLWKIAYGDKIVITLVHLFILTIRILSYGFIIGLIIDVVIIEVIIYSRLFKIREIEKQYFKIEVKN